VVIFTLDWFLYMSRELKAKVIDEATVLADKEGQITTEDRKPVVFCARCWKRRRQTAVLVGIGTLTRQGRIKRDQ
jgi:hypothetical protein